MNNPDIAFTKEVINRTARELGVSSKTINYLYKFCLEYLYKQMEATDCCAFDLPTLGTLYIKSDYLNNELQDKISEFTKDPENTRLRKEKLVLEHKQKALDTHIKISNRPLSLSFHHKKERFSLRYFNHGNNIEEMQDIQNTLYNEYKDRD